WLFDSRLPCPRSVLIETARTALRRALVSAAPIRSPWQLIDTYCGAKVVATRLPKACHLRCVVGLILMSYAYCPKTPCKARMVRFPRGQRGAKEMSQKLEFRSEERRV